MAITVKDQAHLGALMEKRARYTAVREQYDRQITELNQEIMQLFQKYGLSTVNNYLGLWVFHSEGTSKNLDKDALKLNLLRAGVNANVIAKAFGDSVQTSPKKASLSFRPAVANEEDTV